MKINSLLIIVVSLLFTGCFSLTKEIPAYSTYTLNTNTINQNKKLNISDIKLEIKEPKSLQSVNSKYISYSTKNFTSENYALSRWSDTPSKMIQNQIVKYLSSTNNYNFVNNSNINVRSNWQLLSELDSFHQFFKDQKAYVRFSIRVYLKSRNKIYFKHFDYTEQCDQNNAIGAVKGLNNLTNSFVDDLNKWVLNSISKN